jgi:hypothetical protein
LLLKTRRNIINLIVISVISFIASAHAFDELLCAIYCCGFHKKSLIGHIRLCDILAVFLAGCLMGAYVGLW